MSKLKTRFVKNNKKRRRFGVALNEREKTLKFLKTNRNSSSCTKHNIATLRININDYSFDLLFKV
jgi:hypothetical protein